MEQINLPQYFSLLPTWYVCSGIFKTKRFWFSLNQWALKSVEAFLKVHFLWQIYAVSAAFEKRSQVIILRQKTIFMCIRWYSELPFSRGFAWTKGLLFSERTLLSWKAVVKDEWQIFHIYQKFFFLIGRCYVSRSQYRKNQGLLRGYQDHCYGVNSNTGKKNHQKPSLPKMQQFKLVLVKANQKPMIS